MAKLSSTLKSITFAAALSVAGLGNSALAQEAFIDEARLGGTWAQPNFIDDSHAEKDQAGVNVEFLSKPIDLTSVSPGATGILRQLLTPRMHVGAVANFDKNGTSYGYAGLTWHHPLTDTFFIETSFGGSINNGEKNGNAVRASLGSNVTFRESIGLGVNLTESTTLLMQIDHNSHAGLGGTKNRGLTALHMKLGVKF